jgi:DNA polymerase V
MTARGGKRPGSGPKKSMSPYGEKTFLVRLPVSIQPDVMSYLEVLKSNPLKPIPSMANFMKASLHPTIIDIPIYSGKVSAGQSRFPSPAQDYELETLDLNKQFITNPPATYLFKVSGDSMINAGIIDGAVAIVNASIKPKSSSIVVAAVDGEWVVKRLYKRGNIVKLLSENPAYAPIEFKEGSELIIFGVVEHVINPAR